MTNLSDLYTESDLRRLVATEPNPVLRKSYQDKLAALQKSAKPDAKPGDAGLSKAGARAFTTGGSHGASWAHKQVFTSLKDVEALEAKLGRRVLPNDYRRVIEQGGKVEFLVMDAVAQHGQTPEFDLVYLNITAFDKDGKEVNEDSGAIGRGTLARAGIKVMAGTEDEREADMMLAAGSGDLSKAGVRKLTDEELADLPQDWENPTVDTRHYYQSAIEAWEVDQALYDQHRREGGLAQKFKGKYYIARGQAAADLRKYENTYCDGAGDRGNCSGEVRRLPFSDGNLNLCRAHFDKEMAWRVKQNQGAAKADPYDVPRWESLAVVADSKGNPTEKSARPAMRKGVLRWVEKPGYTNVRSRIQTADYNGHHVEMYSEDLTSGPRFMPTVDGENMGVFYSLKAAEDAILARMSAPVDDGQTSDMMLSARVPAQNGRGRPGVRKSDAVVVRGSLHITDAFNGLYLYGKSPDGEDVFLAVAGDGSDDDPMAAPDYDPNDEAGILAEAYGFTIVEAPGTALARSAGAGEAARAGLRKGLATGGRTVSSRVVAKGLMDEGRKADKYLRTAQQNAGYADMALSGNPELKEAQAKLNKARQLLAECRQEVAQVLGDAKTRGKTPPAAAPAEAEAAE